MKPLIEASELLALKATPDLVLVDARTGPGVKEKYNQEHLQNAVFVDLETDLAAKTPDPASGGRHPLPAVSDFANLLGKLGISPESHVVVYDDKNGANAAARFWWMLRATGHKQVQVLNGGYAVALASGYPTNTTAALKSTESAYPFTTWQLPTATIEEVEVAAKDPAYVVIDVRDAARYRGETEPIDLVAGHIPGAVNVPFTSNLDSAGLYLSPDELTVKYKEVLGNRTPEQIIVHCGSGVTACHTLLALDQAGIGIPKLYVGSWSEWSGKNKPIATGA